MVSLATTRRNHKDHEERKDLKMILKMYFVLFVTFVVKNYPYMNKEKACLVTQAP